MRLTISHTTTYHYDDPVRYGLLELRLRPHSTPAQSVLHSGERAVVIVAKGDGLFEPREVRLGVSSGGMEQVTEGLAPGERVVTSSQFLIDSESNLKAAIAQLLGERQSVADDPSALR